MMNKGLGLAVAIAVLMGAAASAEAKQCVWNKGAFVLRVDWFTPGSVQYKVAQFDAAGSVLAGGAKTRRDYSFWSKPVQTDIFPAAQGRCIDKSGTYDTFKTLVLSSATSSPLHRGGASTSPEPTRR